MRDAMAELGGDPALINPQVPVDLVIDHSVVVDEARTAGAFKVNANKEFARNLERFEFLAWAEKAFKNLRVVPPGTGIVHQVNLEYLAKVVFTNDENVLYPDSLVGTDSHTTMINGLGVMGWGCGGIEAESVMLGQPVSMVLPPVLGFDLTGALPPGVTATDLVLTVVAMLRKHGVVGKFVEFHGPGLKALTLADRATIANMAPEYGATMGFFPVDVCTLDYLRLTGRDDKQVELVERYLRANGMFVDHDDPTTQQAVYTETMALDLTTVEACMSGPKRPHDHVTLKNMYDDWHKCLSAPIGFKGFGLPQEKLTTTADIEFEGVNYTLTHGAVVIAAITSCTNTSNPAVMLGAGLVARNAVKRGLKVAPWIKTSLAPGSAAVTKYLANSGLQADLDALGFNLVGYGCTTCIGNSGHLQSTELEEAIGVSDLVCAAVLSGNRNFEGRVHALTRANFLASPPLVVAYALAGTVNIDLVTQPIGKDTAGKDVFLTDLWPTTEEVNAAIKESVKPELFRSTYASVAEDNPLWTGLSVPEHKLYKWQSDSTYINSPPFFKGMAAQPTASNKGVTGARCLLNLGDSVTTDHISPAGSIAKDSPAGKWLLDRGVARLDWNSYGSRRGHDEVMARGTFANVRIVNKLMGGKAGPKTIHMPDLEEGSVFDVAARYKEEGTPTIILAGAEYGSGSSRDWAAKGPYLQGVKCVIATSFERIHRANLVGMGIIPLCFSAGQDAASLGLTGHEVFTVNLPDELKPGMQVTVTADALSFQCTLRFDTLVELEYFAHGGILHYVLRSLKRKG